ncbi:Protein CBG24424 [Caenorhabditis briggsae]|uniref:Protein CBG24424 n=1 Tax=Caenorhabditis briggsae TaxID=6238 RepID=A8WKP3_CAEBR|nr:Protein CBG24424 [Caenorhabditis briggsae]CAP21038.2 Protein CBG24424 [Caenorhabditis briggsae]
MININIKTETPIWARELTEDQLSFYPALPGYEHEIDMPAYQNCMKDSRNCVDDDVKHKNIVVFVVLEEIGKFEKLWGSRCPGKEHLMWPLVGYNVYGRLGVPISLATIKNVFAEQRAKLRQRLSTIIKSNTAISVEDLEERLWKFPEYPLIRYYRKQTQELEKRLRWSGIIGNDGKHIEIFLDEEDRDFEENGFVEPVRDSGEQEGQFLGQGHGEDGQDGQVQARHGQVQASHGQGQASHVPGQANHGQGRASHVPGQTSHVPGQTSHGQGQASHVPGQTSHVPGQTSHGQGQTSHGQGQASHGQGQASHVPGQTSHGQGQTSHGQGQASHGQGHASHVPGQGSHAQVQARHGQVQARQVPGQASHGQGRASHGPRQYSEHGQGQNRRESIENQETEKQISRRSSRSGKDQTPGNSVDRPRTRNGRFLSTKSRKRRSEKAIFEQSGPLLPQHLENQSLTSGAHDCQQTPAPSTRSQAHRQTSERQNLRNNQQQNPVELPPMNRPPPPYVPVQQQYPTPSEAPAPPTYNFNFQNFSEIFKNHLMSIVGYSPEKMRLVRSVLNQTACILDGDLPQNCSQSQIFQKLNSLFPNKNRPN